MKIVVDCVSKGYTLKEGLFKKRKISVLNGVTTHINQGEIIALMGEAKGGKSTLINLLSGRVRPDTGEVLINELNDIDMLRKSCVLIDSFDDKLLVNESVYNNLIYYGKKLGMDELDVEKRIVDLKNVLDFEKIINCKVNELNEINLAKINLATYILDYPAFVFIDEKLDRLSVTSKMVILKDLKRLNKEFKTTIVIASEKIDDVDKICKRVIFVRDGDIVIDDDFEKVKEKYFLNKTVNITFNKSFNLPKGEFNVIENNDYSLVVEIDFNKCDFATLISQFDINTIVDISINTSSVSFK